MQLCLHANIPFPFWRDFTCWLVVPPTHIHFQNYSFDSCFCHVIQLSMKQRSRLKMLVLDCLVFLGCSSKRVYLGRPVRSMFGTELVHWVVGVCETWGKSHISYPILNVHPV